MDSPLTHCTNPSTHQSDIHYASFCNRNEHTCAHFCYKMVHYGIFVSCLTGLCDGRVCLMDHALMWYTGLILGLRCNNAACSVTANILLNQPTFQQSDESVHGVSSKAVDGNYNNEYLDTQHGSCAHTKGTGSGQDWWAVDMGQEYTLAAVTLTNRDSAGTLGIYLKKPMFSLFYDIHYRKKLWNIWTAQWKHLYLTF